MELFYNPERMSEREIKETFIAHQWLVDEIISILKRQPDGPGVQHVVIVAPRGMGKTTMLLMLRFTVLGDERGKQWQPVLFPEESYFVNDLADLWLAVLNHIATETKDLALQNEISTLTTESTNLEEIALARLKNWRAENGKRLFLLIDNFDMILDQIGDERENARLRDVLMNDGILMLVGGATTFFKEARAYNQPLYNLFKIYNLNSLDSNQLRDLLRRRAELDGRKDFDELLRANESRIRVLEYFTGGNPRLVLMLYRIITHSDISEVRRGLEKLLDEVTPYYKAKIETLPPQQRKILDQIARSTSRTREGLTPTEIAKETRLVVNLVSSQLKRLFDAGYVHTANIRGRSSYYTLSEPLYAIWHQMRFGRDARKRMNWLVTFLKDWYDTKELGIECERLLNEFRNYMTEGRQSEARNALEHRWYLTEAIEDDNARITTLEGTILSYLELSDLDTLKDEVLVNTDINSLSQDTQQLLVKAGLVTNEELWYTKVISLLQASQLAEALAAINQVPEEKRKFNAWYTLALILMDLNRNEEAAEAIDRALNHNQESMDALRKKSTILSRIRRYDEALATIEHVLSITSDSGDDWFQRAILLFEKDLIDQAIESMDHVIALTPTDTIPLVAKGLLLGKLGRTAQGLECVEKITELDPTNVDAYLLLGLFLAETNSQESNANLRRAFESKDYDSSYLRKLTSIKCLRVILAAEINHTKEVESSWNDLMQSEERDSERDDWLSKSINVVIRVAQAGHLNLAREMISSGHLEEELFPLARALDHLLTNDEDLIDKLSPEVKRVVIEIISALQPAPSEGSKPKGKKKKSKNKRNDYAKAG